MKREHNLRLFSMVAMCVAVISPTRLHADDLPSRQDVQVIGRVLKFQDDRKGDDVRLAVVYDPANSASQREAVAMVQAMGHGQVVGSISLSGILVDQAKVDASGRFDAVFAARGADAAQVGKAIRGKAIPCVTREMEQVSQGACVVAIQNASGMAIFYSSANAAAAGVHFATAFILMVREL